MKLLRERFDGKYHGVAPPTMLPKGWIAAGQNVRRISAGIGGWKARKGCTLHNTTALETGTAIKSLHNYVNHKQSEQSFIAQCNSKLLVSPQDPPTAAAGTAWTDLGVTVGTTPGSSAAVGEDWFYADGSGLPITWKGTYAYPSGLFVTWGSNVTADTCQSDSTANWSIAVDAVNSTKTFDTDHYEFLSNGDANEIFYKGSLTLVDGREYVASIKVKDGTAASKAIDLVTLNGTTVVSSAQITTTTSWALLRLRFFATSSTNGVGVRIPEDLAGSNLEVKYFTVDEVATEVDYTHAVTNTATSKYAIIAPAITTKINILVPERAKAFVITFGSAVNATASTLTVKAWRSGALAAVSGLSDGTSASGGKTLGQNGTISFTASASDTMFEVGGVQGYLYELSWGTALSQAVHIVTVKVQMDACATTNKWSGEWEWTGGALFYDYSANTFENELGSVTNESTSQYLDLSSATTDDELWIKGFESIAAFGFGVVPGYVNSNEAVIDSIRYWNGQTWASATIVKDTTKDVTGYSSLSQNGKVYINADAITPQARTVEGDDLAGYWYRIKWSGTLSSDTRVYACLYAAMPLALGTTSGCVEFKGRLFTWGPEYGNKLRYSARDFPDTFSGTDSGFTYPFGDSSPILAAICFYNELVIFKEDSVWMLEGYSKATFGNLHIATGIGISSRQSLQIMELGYPSAHADEPMSILIWQDTDGVYVLDGRKPRKVSGPVDHYFNPEFSTCVAAASIESLASFVDHINAEYHLILPSYELVYNIISDEWYPVWTRALPLACGLELIGSDNRYYQYGATSGGFVCKLENDTTDKSAANADVAIEHFVRTRALLFDEDIYGQETTSFFLCHDVQRLWAEFKAQSAGAITVKTLVDLASSATTQAKTLSLVNSGKAVAVPGIALATLIERAIWFQVELYSNTTDVEMEVRGIMLTVAGRGVPDVQ